MSLDQESRKAIVDYRVERAEATIVEAKGVAESGWYNLSVNRLYPVIGRGITFGAAVQFTTKW